MFGHIKFKMVKGGSKKTRHVAMYKLGTQHSVIIKYDVIFSLKVTLNGGLTIYKKLS